MPLRTASINGFRNEEKKHELHTFEQKVYKESQHWQVQDRCRSEIWSLENCATTGEIAMEGSEDQPEWLCWNDDMKDWNHRLCGLRMEGD